MWKVAIKDKASYERLTGDVYSDIDAITAVKVAMELCRLIDANVVITLEKADPVEDDLPEA